MKNLIFRNLPNRQALYSLSSSFVAYGALPVAVSIGAQVYAPAIAGAYVPGMVVRVTPSVIRGVSSASVGVYSAVQAWNFMRSDSVAPRVKSATDALLPKVTGMGYSACELLASKAFKQEDAENDFIDISEEGSTECAFSRQDSGIVLDI